jgi:hypothetical protein
MTDDYLWNAVEDHWEMILDAYNLYEQHRPIVLYDIQEQRIYVYPYQDFKDDLSARNQALLTNQYQKAIVSSKIVVFVRDNVERRLESFSVEYEGPKRIQDRLISREADREA